MCSILRAARSRQIWYRLLAILLLLLLIAGGIGLAVWGWRVNEICETARKSLDRHDPQEALGHLDRVLRLRPNHPVANLLAARAHRQLDALGPALDHLEQCRNNGGKDLDEYRLEALLLRAQQGEVAEIESKLASLLQKDVPESALVLEALALGSIRAQENWVALSFIERWLEQQADNPRAHFHRGVLHQRRNEIPQALSSFRRSVELSPDHFGPQYGLAEMLVLKALFDEALPYAEYCYRKTPDNRGVLLLLAACYRGTGQIAKAWELLKQVEQSQDSQVLLEVGLLQIKEKRWKEAAETLAQVLDLAPGSIEAHYHLSEALGRLGRPADAAYHKAEFKKREIALNSVKQLQAEIGMTPHDADLHHRLGKLYLDAGIVTPAMESFGSALRNDPFHQPTHRVLVGYYTRIGKTAKAVEHRRQLREEMPPP